MSNSEWVWHEKEQSFIGSFGGRAIAVKRPFKEGPPRLPVRAYVENEHMLEPAKLCVACGERPAECMGDLCFKCDHLEGDKGSND